ncbi:hypothetical protein [Rhizobium bangladeshense]|uniref:hypothetical protein n=1 Tax=Rhizobium bangladeshense TaxID=1138189 RepID=UPI001C839494|nr:hypothetical protein [Rhizobium bangladeshense]MBX4888776.1 hypothetical protein [Rhizobium bangladeshense]MBX4919405.1 hypothetical protein [Rhizobium bangladeshense]
MSEREIAKTQLLDLLSAANNGDAAKSAVSILFPRAKELLQAEILDTGEKDNATTGRRIRNADFARLYFLLTPKTVVWSKSQANELMEAEPDVAFAVFESRIHAVSPDERPKLRRIILELLEETMRNRADTRQQWIIALLDNASLLLTDEGWESSRLFEPSSEDLVRIMLTQVLMASSQDDRVGLLKEVVKHASDVSLLCELVRSITGDAEPAGTTFKPDSLGDATQEVRDLLLDRVQRLAADGGLSAQIRPGPILWYWWGCGYADQVRAYTNQLMTTNEGIRLLLEIPISYVRSTAGNYERIDRKSWEKIIDLRQLEEHARLLAKSTDEEGARLALRFLDALRHDERM